MMVLPAGCIADVLNVGVIGFELAPATRSADTISKAIIKIRPEDVIVPEPTPSETVGDHRRKYYSRDDCEFNPGPIKWAN